jgi:light-regulated signal transduction histidine kinase (bacteriophytochrome)
MNASDIRPKEDIKKFMAINRKIGTGLHIAGEWTHIKKDGTQIQVEVSADDIIFENKLSRLIISNDITKKNKAAKEIKILNEGLEQKIIERTSQLQAVNKELEAFTYSVSHDLRTPLRAINGYSSMLEEDYSNLFDDNGKRLLARIKLNTSKMGTLIDDLLAFSRLGRQEVKKSKIDMNELVNAVHHQLNQSIKHNAVINIAKLSPLMGDYALISQVMMNLIGNAIKYSGNKENPIIEINEQEINGTKVYFVKDNGAGFDMQYATNLFGVFQRMHSNEDFEGTGVGLAIVQKIINKHGGKIWADAKVEVGATFFFSLP